MANIKELRDKLYELKLQSRQQLLEVMGIDLRKLRALEDKQDKAYQKLEQQVQSAYKKSGSDIAKRHEHSLTYALHAMAQQIDHSLAVSDRFAQLESYLFFCRCHYPHTAEIKGSGEEIEQIPSYGNTSDGSVEFVTNSNRARMMARADSPHTGESGSARVKAWFKFAFTPETNDTYCIRPIAHLNGFWTSFSGSGCETYESLPIIGMETQLFVRVEQLSEIVQSTYHDVLFAPVPGDFARGFDYDSEVNEDLTIEVELQGGDQAVIFVECRLSAYANNGSHAKLDLLTSPHFYFEVPTVKWGKPCRIPTIIHNP